MCWRHVECIQGWYYIFHRCMFKTKRVSCCLCLKWRPCSVCFHIWTMTKLSLHSHHLTFLQHLDYLWPVENYWPSCSYLADRRMCCSVVIMIVVPQPDLSWDRVNVFFFIAIFHVFSYLLVLLTPAVLNFALSQYSGLWLGSSTAAKSLELAHAMFSLFEMVTQSSLPYPFCVFNSW